MGWNYYIYIHRGVVYHCSFHYIGLWSASKSGMSMVKGSRFSFIHTNHICHEGVSGCDS